MWYLLFVIFSAVFAGINLEAGKTAVGIVELLISLSCAFMTYDEIKSK